MPWSLSLSLSTGFTAAKWLYVVTGPAGALIEPGKKLKMLGSLSQARNSTVQAVGDTSRLPPFMHLCLFESLILPAFHIVGSYTNQRLIPTEVRSASRNSISVTISNPPPAVP